ncbi:MurR/RpiR family transcriptional regulator [Nocardia zapadnayensis]|uniref:MurR/RpiR family transcriptional regulator n=1 Tax=Nocardia rhamnosiphila TaxID=426716 RepID=UPI0022470381|nr:MurR/RpiR family transcriptional regulator [Nocardia zapadnayensis]MCX0274209.1 MurR/RpiR family transcriptional regulator [Nocardia zapadnayensis]
MKLERMTDSPQTFAELLTELRARRDNLSAAHRKLADRVMADPEAVAFMTVSELASVTGVNEATVVRFATAFGLPGFPGLTRLCREWLREQAQLLRRFDNLEQLADTEGGIIPRALAYDQANLVRTFARVDESAWESAVDRLATADRVHIMGLRKCHTPAYLLAYLLKMLREDVSLITAAAGALTDDLRAVRPGDCFVAISIHRYTADTVRSAQWAQAAGAHVVALTDNHASPLVSSAHDVFFVDASAATVLRSMTGFVALVQALVAEVARRNGQEARASLLQEEQLLSDFQVYAAEPSE